MAKVCGCVHHDSLRCATHPLRDSPLLNQAYVGIAGHYSNKARLSESSLNYYIGKAAALQTYNNTCYTCTYTTPRRDHLQLHISCVH